MDQALTLLSRVCSSRTDEDIILHDRRVSYTNSTVREDIQIPIRLLSHQLVVNAPLLQWSLRNRLQEAPSTPSSTAISMIIPVNIGTNEQKRIVEWLDGNGEYGQESGTIKVTVETNWGNFVADMPLLKPYCKQSTLSILNSVSTKSNQRQQLLIRETHGAVTVSNTGSISVNPNVRCYVGDDEADTTANTCELGSRTRPQRMFHLMVSLR